MNWYERWHAFTKLQTAREREFIDKYFDHNTYSGAFRGLLVFFIGGLFAWHFYDISAWVENLLDLHYDPVSPAKKSWIKLWTIIVFGGGALISIFAMTILIPIRRYRTKKQAQKTNPNADASEKPRE